MENVVPQDKLIHNLNPKTEGTFNLTRFILLLFIVVILGVGTGFIISKFKTSLKGNVSQTKTTNNSQKTAGIADKKTFKDKAEGILREGGADGEGNFHLERPGGDSQNVYLTSTTVDLSQYIGKKVRVWGETFQAQKAGWLMDVGLVESLQ